MFHVAMLTMRCCLWIMLQEVIFLPLKRWNPMQAVSDKSTVAPSRLVFACVALYRSQGKKMLVAILSALMLVSTRTAADSGE